MSVSSLTHVSQAPHNIVRFKLDDNSQHQDLFQVESATGELFLRRSLVGDAANQYTVCAAHRFFCCLGG